MKKVLIIGAIFAATCALAAWLWLDASVFGVSKQHPIGDFAQIRTWLTNKEFTSEERDAAADDDSAAPDGTKEVLYRHEFTERTDTRPSLLTFTLDSAGSYRSVNTRFWSGKEELRHPGFHGARAEHFINTLWMECSGGRKPAFEEEFVGKGKYRRQMLVATFRNHGASGRWEKRYDTNTDARTIFDAVTIGRD